MLTPEGHAALAQVSAFRQSVVADATAGWTAEDRATLADLLTRFVRDFAAQTDRS